MTALRSMLVAGGASLVAIAAVPASAQFFLQPKDVATLQVTGDPSGAGVVMPDATPAEVDAAKLWNMRAALNVAALQCQFEPTLLVVDNYNAMLTDHKAELDGAVKTLGKYFTRINKTPKAGQAAYDQFNTRVYASFATVGGKLGFCQTANRIGSEALFAPRGTLGAFAATHLRDLRASLTPFGEQRFLANRYIGPDQSWMPRMDPICWDKKGQWVFKKCGVQAPVATTPVATAPALPAPAVAPAAPAAAPAPVAAVVAAPALASAR